MLCRIFNYNLIARHIITTTLSYLTNVNFSNWHGAYIRINRYSMKLYISILLLSLYASAYAQPAQKTTAAKKRLIASSSYSETMLMDSNIHYYSSLTRGSVHTTEKSYYDLFLNSDIEPQSIFCDSTVNYSLVPGRGLIRFFSRTYKYNSLNQTESFVIKHLGNQRTHYNITYNTLGKPVLLNFVDTDMNGTLTNAYNRAFAYNTAGKLIQDSNYYILYATPYTKKLYGYDARGNDTLCNTYNFDGTLWVHASIITKKYDSRNRLISILNLYNINGVYTNTRLDSFIYRGTDTVFNKHSIYDWNDNQAIWQKGEQKSVFFSSNKLTDTLIYQYGPSLDTLHRKITYYDTAYKLITAIKYYKHLGANRYATLPFTENYFYFQTYGQTSISSINADIPVTIAPNPSKGAININAGTASFNGVVITDIQGRIVYAQSLPETHNAIITTQLSAGSYILSVYYTQTKINSTQIIIQ